MITLIINHINYLCQKTGYQHIGLETFSDISFNSPASLFFLMAGYMVGMVYLSRPTFTAELLRRAALLYAFNVVTFAVVAVIAYAGPDAIAAASNYDYVFASPVRGTVEFLLFLQHPYLLGVLQVYVLFMATAPLFAIALARAPLLAVAVSATLYCVVQFHAAFNLPGGAPTGDHLWNFNPFAWQFLFFGAVAAGKLRLFEQAFTLMDRHRWLAIPSIVAAGAIVVAQYLSIHVGFYIPQTGKTALEPMRLASALIVAAALMSLLVLLKPWLAAAPFRWLGMIGGNSLNCFTFSIPATYLGAEICLASGNSRAGYFTAVAVVLAGVTLVAVLSQRAKARKVALRSAPAGSGRRGAGAALLQRDRVVLAPGIVERLAGEEAQRAGDPTAGGVR